VSCSTLALRHDREGNGMIKKAVILSFILMMIIHLVSCANNLGSTVISRPDEYTRVYEAKEKIILNAIAGVIKDKKNGDNVSIDLKNKRVM
jgi:hypothetical protein